jgi:purine-binding chemotaxis protein CheW
MAKVNDKDSQLDERISVVEIGGKLFGIEVLKSREVFPLPQITKVPNTKIIIIGVFNLRGEIYPLVDISPILDMKPKTIQQTDMVILIEEKGTVMGVICDRIHDVQMINIRVIKPAHGSVPKIMEDLVSGIIKDKTTEIYLLNIERLFSSFELSSYA